MVILVVMMMSRCRRRVIIRNQGESADGNTAADTFTQGGLPAVGRYGGSQVGKNSGLQIRQRIKHRGDEHVAGHTAGRVQVDMIVFSHDCQKRELRTGLPG